MTDNEATVIGAHTHVQGRIEGDQELHVLGRVDGQISLTRTLTVDAKAIVVADVQATRALISGTMVGNVTASELIHIFAEGRVVGDLVAPRVVLEDGAAFRGNVDMGDLDAPLPRLEGQRTPPRLAAEPRPPAAGRPAPPRPAPPRPTPPRPVAAPVSRPASRVEPAQHLAEPRRERPSSRSSSPTSEAETLERRAEAAAEALSRAGGRSRSAVKQNKPAPAVMNEGNGKSVPKPPTAAGKRSRARKK